VTSLDDTREVRASADGPASEARRLGSSVAQQLLAQGAAEILAEAGEGPAGAAR